MESSPPPTFRELLVVFARIGCLSFGGPAGQIGLMHREIVEDRRWIEESAYLRALNFCHLLPGPEAQQLATWIGWRLHGVAGGLAAGLLFVIPGALVMLLLSLFYAMATGQAWVAALFLGIKVAVLAVVVQALLRIARRALDTALKRVLACASFAALFFFALPFPVIVLGAGVVGIFAARLWPHALGRHMPGPDAPERRPLAAGISLTLRTLATGLVLWGAPMLVILLVLGPDHVLWNIGAFFAKLAVVTFGGAYAVLSYMAQQAVQVHGWLGAREMADGLGLAETTPGPLIMVTQFVGTIAAWRAPEPFSPLLAGIIGAALTTWMTFVPCFLWIFTFAPWMERLENVRWLQSGLAALTAAVVGVIANLSLWFALHVLFTRVAEVRSGPLHLSIPEWASLDWRAAGLALLGAVLLFRARWPVWAVLGVCAACGLVLRSVA
ncbi:chromate efflux transporter [Sphingobium subterraneum]|uniref:Chromate transporter n=1 Tax=Sphingobium subterraneum TaxID=627688 RepID=A0A841J2H5_9SPHN|nr:chromate efflux transporter [Sphingobium subterraneum]MBB6122521.1 chromate transporter [Sphingobium subterraneum]